jgi:hypothetical protein
MAMSIPVRTFVDAALALNEIPQLLIQILELRGVPQRPRPFALRAVIDLSGSDVHRMTAANGSGSLTAEYPRRCNAR